MYKHCTTEESAQRQRQLEQYLLELMADTPYTAITIAQICERANISRKSFYRYFDSKEGCLHALLDHTIMNGSAYYLPEAADQDSGLLFCIRVFEYWKIQTPLLNALEKNALSLQLLQRIVHYILTEEPQYAQHMGISPDFMLEHVTYTVGGLMGLVLTWHHEGYKKTAAQMGQILYHMTQHS